MSLRFKMVVCRDGILAARRKTQSRDSLKLAIIAIRLVSGGIH